MVPAVNTRLLTRLVDQLVHFVQVSAGRDVPQRSGASLRDHQITAVQGHGHELLPHRFCFRRHLQCFEDVHRPCIVAIVYRSTELYEGFVKEVGRLADALVHDDLSAASSTLNFFHGPPNLMNSHLIRRVNVVPDVQRSSRLCHDHVAVRHPLHVRAVVQQGRSTLLIDVIQVQLPALVAEQQETATPIELQPIDLRVVGDGGGRLRHQILHTQSLQIKQVCDLLVFRVIRAHPTVEGLARRPLVHSDAQQVARDVVCPDRPEDLVLSVFHQAELARAIHDAAAGRVEDELFVRAASGPAPVPLHLRQLERLEVSQEQGLRGVRNDKAILKDVDLGDLAAVVAAQHDAGAGTQPFDDDLRQAHIRELEATLVSMPPNACVVDVQHSAERPDG
eukprot:scaffold2224_cov261-Pinguiococcus_pyrenoidosus.AAC.42